MALPNHIATLVQEINTCVRDESSSSSEQRANLRSAARRLLIELEEPEEQAQRFALQPMAQACMCAAWKGGILKPWPSSRQTAADISSSTGVNKTLVCKFWLRAPSPETSPALALNLFDERDTKIMGSNGLCGVKHG
jgi:hypothetical protein